MEYLYLGKIVNTHGIKGEIRILSNFRYKDKAFKKKMPIYIGKSKTQEIITSYRHHKQFEMICLENYDNINQVLKYKGEKIYIKPADLNLEQNQYLDEELQGLNIKIDNQIVGIIKRIERYPKQDLIVVKKEEKDCLIPYVSDIIEEVNLKEGYIAIKNIKGLI